MNKLKHLPLILVLLLSLLVSARLIRPGYFSMQDDMQVFRLEQFDTCIHDGQIPCRFIPDGGMGYGYPLYNYYSPLPYILAEGVHLTGVSYINSIKTVFVFGHFLGGIGMFLFASLFFGSWGGLISAAFFILAPYQALDSYVRGAIAEFLALNLLPWIFWSFTKYLQKASPKYFYFSVLFLTALLLSHNLLAMVSLPLLCIYVVFKFRSLRSLALPVVLSLGLSAFFLIPALLEKNLVTVDTMTQGYFNFIIHFATLKQLFLAHNDWGYGASLWGPKDDMSFQIGYIHWIIPFALAAFFSLNRRLRSHKSFPIIIFFVLFSLFSVFLTHNKSTFIWQSLPFMAYFQFPWRFLAFAIFGFSFAAGAVFLLPLAKPIKAVITSTLIIGVLVLNIGFFKEDIWYPNMTDQEKLSPQNVLAQSGAGLKDYWPKGSLKFPDFFAPSAPTSTPSTATITNYSKKSNRLSAKVTVADPNTTITFPLVYFPGWRLYVNNQPSDIKIDPELGLVTTVLNTGTYDLNLVFTNTTIRLVADLLSLASLISLIIMAVYYSKND